MSLTKLLRRFRISCRTSGSDSLTSSGDDGPDPLLLLEGSDTGFVSCVTIKSQIFMSDVQKQMFLKKEFIYN